jgi:hypothetical protein
MNADPRSQIMAEGIKQEKIRRAMLAGPSCVTSQATVAELNLDGSMTVLRPGTNEWTCVPGDQNVVGAADMCADPMGMAWMKDLMAGKPEPTNTLPGLIYMLNGDPAQLHRSVRPDQPRHPHRPALDAHLAVRRDGRRDGHHHARRRHHGHVRRHTVRAPAHLRLALGRE